MNAGRTPLNRLTDWLLGSRVRMPLDVSDALRGGLFASTPIFLGGVFNTIAVAGIAAWRYPTAPFIGWLLFEICLGIVRLGTLMIGRRAIAAGRTPPFSLLFAFLSCLWAGSIGYGAFICVMIGDWVMTTIVCLSASAMVCGICLRNFGTPRLAALMVCLALTPCALAGWLAAEPVMKVISIQLPIYMAVIFAATFALHKMLISRMIALTDLKLSESFNRTILQFSPDYTLLLNRECEVVFSNSPYSPLASSWPAPQDDWLERWRPEHRAMGKKVLARVRTGQTGSFTLCDKDADGRSHWFEVIANMIADGSGRTVVVARDITHQKLSEEKALWMAHHDALTGLPNRPLLQERLDSVLERADKEMVGALLLLDVDNFKIINDTMGHDAGDALLTTFAARLKAALAESDLIARTGGDEFAIILPVDSEDQVDAKVRRIFSQLRRPFNYEGRLLECSASVGASFIPRDGTTRAEIFKAADIALYAAKAAGRAQIKVFEPAMMVEVERHQGMIAAARQALQMDSIEPYYQPKISLGTGQVNGFEALLRWRNADGEICAPRALGAAFEDPRIGHVLGQRMLEKVLDDVSAWIAADVPFGHVAINVAAVDFRSGAFAENLLSQLKAKGVPTSAIQIEVTETAFLGRGSEHVEEALELLSENGIRIALDDFGTGYASLSHLNQYPVDLLKIDRSFIDQIGSNADTAAICSAVINLGHCLGMEVVAEGIETRDQEAHLIGVGCDTGQGYLYSSALAAADVPALVHDQPFMPGPAERSATQVA